MAADGETGRFVLRPVESLLPHEEYIHVQVERLAQQIEKDGIQRDPIIIDQENAVVLDGTHRLAAFKKLGVEHAVCYAVDYSAKWVELHRWVRVFEVPSQRMLRQLLDELGGWREATTNEAFEAADGRTGAAFVGEKCYVNGELGEVPRCMEFVGKFDGVVLTVGWRRTFAAEHDLDVELQTQDNVALVTPKVRKADVIDAGLTKRLFPCKTTMHVIDPRPLGVNFPLEGLRRKSPPEEELADHIRSAKRQLLPAGSEYGGRRYKERIIVMGEL